MLKKLTRSGFALKTVLASIALSIAGAAQAQVKVGDNVNTLTPSAVLEAESITQGFLPPRMLQVQMNAIVSPATGLIVYCLDCMPASPYFYNGTAWLSFVNGNPTAAAYAANSLSCTGTLAGTYTQGIALTSGNTKTITITVNAAGGYSAATSVVNGVSFAGNGAFATTGANKTVTLTGTGTPTAAGTFAYTASLGGQTCTFNVTYSSASTAAVFSCVSPTVTQSPAGALVNGTAYTGTYTLPYTGGNGAAYGSAAQTVSGLTLTRTAGTYAAGGGNVVYNLTGTYTGNTGAASFSIAECGTFSFPAGQVSTVTGNGNYGYQDGPVATAEFNTPQGIAIDAAGNIYVGDMANNNIRKITPSGTVSTFAGSINNPNGTGAAYVNATGSAARFDKPTGLAIDASGNIYVADKNNNSIRKITPAGAVTTLAGSTTGASGNTNATGTSALFSGPTGVAVDASGNVYVADAGNHRIRRIDGTTLAVTTLAGSSQGFNDATGTTAQFFTPTDVALNGSGTLYVADRSNNRIRKIIIATGAVTTLAGSSYGYSDNVTGPMAQFAEPTGLTLDGAGNIYVSDYNNFKIRKVAANGAVTTVAGSTSGFQDGAAATAKFNYTYGITLDASGNILVIDQNNNRVRKIAP